MNNFDISLHAPEFGMEITGELPWNSGCIKLRPVGGTSEITLYLPLAQWWALRSVFPKAVSEYVYHTEEETPSIRNHTMADAAAASFWSDQQPAADTSAASTIEHLRRAPLTGDTP